MSKLTFYGGVGMVTGANFLLEIDPSGSKQTGKPLKILIDCGLIQGQESSEDLNQAEFAYLPSDIDYLFVTHAHLDHIGRIPKLVRDGFRGEIISTQATKEIAELLFFDALKIMENDTRKNGTKPLYALSEISETMSRWHTLPYHSTKELSEEVSVILYEAGHILGSAMVEITRHDRRIVFTGDLGNSPSLLLKDPEKVSNANYLLMESVYGDRNHSPKAERQGNLQKAIEYIIGKKGTLVIPAFSLERTQMIIYELNELFENKKIKSSVPVFLDSPLAIKITNIYEKYSEEFNERARADITSGDDIFNFPGLRFIVQSGESKMIEKVPGPKIILAGSGMSVGGRVILHEKQYISDPRAEILFVGYQSPGSLGREIQDGAKKVFIFDEEKEVRAKIESINGYSSHMDSDHLLEFVAKATESGKLEQVFVAMGEPKASMFLIQKLRDNLGVNAVYPKIKQKFEIDL